MIYYPKKELHRSLQVAATVTMSSRPETRMRAFSVLQERQQPSKSGSAASHPIDNVLALDTQISLRRISTPAVSEQEGRVPYLARVRQKWDPPRGMNEKGSAVQSVLDARQSQGLQM